MSSETEYGAEQPERDATGSSPVKSDPLPADRGPPTDAPDRAVNDDSDPATTHDVAAEGTPDDTSRSGGEGILPVNPSLPPQSGPTTSSQTDEPGFFDDLLAPSPSGENWDPTPTLAGFDESQIIEDLLQTVTVEPFILGEDEIGFDVEAAQLREMVEFTALSIAQPPPTAQKETRSHAIELVLSRSTLEGRTFNGRSFSRYKVPLYGDVHGSMPVNSVQIVLSHAALTATVAACEALVRFVGRPSELRLNVSSGPFSRPLVARKPDKMIVLEAELIDAGHECDAKALPTEPLHRALRYLESAASLDYSSSPREPRPNRWCVVEAQAGVLIGGGPEVLGRVAHPSFEDCALDVHTSLLGRLRTALEFFPPTLSQRQTARYIVFSDEPQGEDLKAAKRQFGVVRAGWVFSGCDLPLPDVDARDRLALYGRKLLPILRALHSEGVQKFQLRCTSGSPGVQLILSAAGSKGHERIRHVMKFRVNAQRTSLHHGPLNLQLRLEPLMRAVEAQILDHDAELTAHAGRPRRAIGVVYLDVYQHSACLCVTNEDTVGPQPDFLARTILSLHRPMAVRRPPKGSTTRTHASEVQP